MKILLAGILCLLFGYRLGYEIAHTTIARECERLGGFYVGKKTYKCTTIDEPTEHEEQNEPTHV